MHEPVLSAIAPAGRKQWVIPGLVLGAGAACVAALTNPWGVAATLGILGFGALVWWVGGGYDRWFLAFAVSTCLLPPLPIAIGTTGPHVALFAALLGLWIGIARMSTWRIRNEPLPIALLGFWILMACSLAPAALESEISVVALGLARLGLFGVSLFTFFYFAYCRPDSASRELRWWVRLLFGLAVVSALFACLDFYFQWPPPAGFGEQYVWLTGTVYRRAQGFFYEASTLGNFCAFFLLLVAVAWVRASPGSRVLSLRWSLPGAATLVAALVFSFSRSSVVSLFVAISTLLLLERRRIRLGRWLGMATVGLGGGLALVWIVAPTLTGAYLMRLWLTATGLMSNPDVWLSGRITSWTTLLEFLADNPVRLLTGIGYATLPHTELLGRTVLGDNMYLTVLVETGVLGFLAMMGLLLAILAAALRVSRSGDETASFVGTWIFCFWMGQLAQMLSVDVLTFWRVLPIYMALLGMAVHRAHASHAETGSE
jgi:O-antigen ligase